MTNKSEYYKQMKMLAQQKRKAFDVDSKKIGLRLIREIYKKERITIDYRNIKSSRIRASYFSEDGDCSVLVKKSLPTEQRLFALAHELKHHYVDKEDIEHGKFECGKYNENQLIEIGAEVFAAEFIFPESHMFKSLTEFDITRSTITPQKIVEYKMNCDIPVSYKFILKRLKWFRIIDESTYSQVQFQKLEDTMYPKFYKEAWFKNRRKLKLVSGSIPV